MYRPTLNSRDRGGALVAVAAIHAGLLFAFLNLTGTIDIGDPQRVMRVFDVLDPEPPPPPPPPPPPVQQQQKPKEKEGGSAPKNIKSEATPVVAPRPRVVIPVPPKVAVSETPREGTAPTQGASDVAGPGSGAGGTGTGTGAGGSGSGTGGGGDGIATGPRIIGRTLTSRDYPRALARAWPRGGRVFVAFRVQVNGTATNCRVDRSSGNPGIDAETCRLVQTRLRFRPAMNRRGEPVVAWYGYIQAEVGG